MAGEELERKLVLALGYGTEKYSNLIDKVHQLTGRPRAGIKSALRRTTYIESTNDGWKLTDAGVDIYREMKKSMERGSKDRYAAIFQKEYISKCLEPIWNKGASIIEIPYKKLELADMDLADDLLYNADTILPELEDACINHLESTIPNAPDQLQINVVDLPNTLQPHEIRAEHTGHIIQVRGRVTQQQDDILPRMMEAAFLCKRCNHTTKVKQTTLGRLKEPLQCENEMCLKQGPFDLDTMLTEYVNGQIIYVEPEEGRSKLKIALTEELCAAPWDRDGRKVLLTGVLKQVLITTRNGKTTDTEPYLEARTIKMDDDEDIKVTKADKELFQTWLEDPEDLEKRIIGSLAPYIEDMDDIKDSMTLSLFSDWGWKNDWKDNRPKSSLHGLIIGDPGLAKTALIRDMHIAIAPKGIYQSGEGATGKGLSNSAVQEDQKWVIKSGLFTEADGGNMGLDELDKLPDEDYAALVSILETQSQTVAKVGLRRTFNTRAATWMGANPKSGNIDPLLPIFSQMGFKSWLATRVNVTWAIRDERDAERDEMIATAMAANIDDKGTIYPRAIELQLLRKYIIYARSFPEQKLTELAERKLKDAYRDIRMDPKYNEIKSYITPRVAASLFLVAKCIARRVCAKEVESKHADYAIELYQKSLNSLLMDQDGNANWNLETVVMNGKPEQRRELLAVVQSAIRGGSYTTKDLKATLPSLTTREIDSAIRKLQTQGRVINTECGLRSL